MAQKRIALLATGDEIINGDILNTNAQQIAKRCFGEQILVGQHMVVADNEQELVESINHLLKTHDALITIGGLGPTSDDRTRFAIAKALDTPLEHDEDTWQYIQNRLAEFSLSSPESNQQQALFPQGSTILANPNGTACGCMAKHKQVTQKDKLIFMLPGPPKECLPMFNDYVLQALLKNHFSSKRFFYKWLLFMVSEGHVAEQTENLLKQYPSCDPAYRIAFPYLEVKLLSQQQAEFTKAVALLDDTFSKSKFHDGHWRASDLLVNKLQQSKVKISIKDEATGGLLEQQLTNPGMTTVNFHQTQKNAWLLKVSGLTSYWRNNQEFRTYGETPSCNLSPALGKPALRRLRGELPLSPLKTPPGKCFTPKCETPNSIKTCELMITLISPEDKTIKQDFQIPYRSDRTPLYAMEYCCKFLLGILFDIR
jgi:nicotinamide-nucleotide amidase